ncbi:MAG: hypothetical protein IMY72_08300 [Bacteroidetes bacterium]|nr:hypothetical protein [Bacteroidota bacterium]
MKKIVMLIFACALLFSCKDKNTYDPAYLTGAWQCEELGSITLPRRYQVDIERDILDTTIYIIHNFYKTGYETDVWFSLKDNLIDIKFQPVGRFSFTGNGTISDDLTTIELEYDATIFEGVDEIRATYRR